MIVFTDGSAQKNGKMDATGGIGVVFPEHPAWNHSERVEFQTFNARVTNNVTELYAIAKAIDIALHHGCSDLIIYTDSEYCLNIFTKWARKWESNDWRKTDGAPILNKERIQQIWELQKQHVFDFRHCRSHQREPEDKSSHEHFVWDGNRMADRLATTPGPIKGAQVS